MSTGKFGRIIDGRLNESPAPQENYKPITHEPVPEFDQETEAVITGLPIERENEILVTCVVVPTDAMGNEEYATERKRLHRQAVLERLATTPAPMSARVRIERPQTGHKEKYPYKKKKGGAFK
ncbi:MAG: hypothetical protein FWF59_02260 [Turicibacter sp.]|nr:hypothetical protein [Turicibacter sp.]